MIAPTTVAIIDPISPPTAMPSKPNSQPPISAPITPTTMLPTRPKPPPLMICPAIQPATAPITKKIIKPVSVMLAWPPRGGPPRKTGTGSLRRVAAAAEEAVLGPLAGLVELRRLRPHTVDRCQCAGYRRAAVDRRHPRHQLGIIGFGGLAEKGADPARPREGCDVGDRVALPAEKRYGAEPLLEGPEH